MSHQGFYSADEVRNAASGRWALLHGALAPQLEPALRKMGKHVPCPIHGGKDGFRLMSRNYGERGAGVCNTCGVKTDGINLLMWVNNWSFPETIEELGRELGLERKLLPGQEAAKRRQEWKTKQVSRGANKKAIVKRTEPTINVMPTHHQTTEAGFSYSAKAEGENVYQGVKEAAAINYDAVPATTMTAATPAKQLANTVTPIKHEAAAMDIPVAARTEKWLHDLQKDINNKRAVGNAYTVGNIKRVWEKSLPLTTRAAAPFWKYLANRGIMLKDLSALMGGENLRIHPNLEYREEQEVEEERNGESVMVKKNVVVGTYPALICAIRDAQGEIVTLHRTYLSKAGNKAKVESPRKMMPVPEDRGVLGASIRIGLPINGVLGVAEGLETALSGYRASGIPTWSCVNTTILEAFEPPEGVHTVIIWADKDKSFAGETAANALKTRLEEKGLRVFVMVPRQPIPARSKSIDWNDVLKKDGILGFPNPIMLRSIVFKQEVQNA